MAFLNRETELAALQTAWQRPGAQLLVVLGRRRVGKTDLLAHFGRDKLAVHFQAAQVADEDNLAQLQLRAGEVLDDPTLSAAGLRSWEALLSYLGRAYSSRRLIVVLDEFPYLCQSNPALPSLLQRFWDQEGRHSRLFLILCGSALSFMEDTLGERSPLFGRRTGQLEVAPLNYREAALFFPRYSATDQVRTYGMLGGMPMYLAQFDPAHTIRSNALSHLLAPTALLYNEPEYLLRAELREPALYNSLLWALATGLTKPNELAQRIGRPATTMGRYLDVLERLRLVRRVQSYSDRAPARPSKGRYFIADNFIRFWYHFLLPQRSALEVGQAPQVWEKQVEPHLDAFTSISFEQICRDYLRRFGQEAGLPPPVGEVGRFWNPEAEIDAIYRDAEGATICAECKWSRRPLGLEVWRRLQGKCLHLPPAWHERLRCVLFSRSGFDDGLQRAADGEQLVLVDVERLYRP